MLYFDSIDAASNEKEAGNCEKRQQQQRQSRIEGAQPKENNENHTRTNNCGGRDNDNKRPTQPKAAVRDFKTKADKITTFVKSHAIGAMHRRHVSSTISPNEILFAFLFVHSKPKKKTCLCESVLTYI